MELGGSYAGAYLLRRGLFMPWELGQVLAPDVVTEGLGGSRRCASSPASSIRGRARRMPKSLRSKSSLYMRNQLLRDTDWASMAHGLEVRVPLVDAALLRKVAPWILARAPARAAAPKAVLAASPVRPLPSAVVARAKTGFTTPIARWLQTDGLPSYRNGRAAAQSATHRTLVAAMGGAARGCVRCASLPSSPMASAPVAASPGTTRP